MAPKPVNYPRYIFFQVLFGLKFLARHWAYRIVIVDSLGNSVVNVQSLMVPVDIIKDDELAILSLRTRKKILVLGGRAPAANP